jgi:hypothetical protein
MQGETKAIAKLNDLKQQTTRYLSTLALDLAAEETEAAPSKTCQQASKNNLKYSFANIMLSY